MFLLFIQFFACTQEDESLYQGPTGEGNNIFCSTFDDANDFIETELESLTGENGRLKVQLIIDSDDPRDDEVVGGASYTLENPSIGGAQQRGTASPLGEFSKTLGSGDWVLAVKGETGCDSEDITATITAGTETYLCVPLYCD